MGTCFCTGACREGRACAAFPHGAPWLTGPLETGRTWRVPLSEEEIRRIVREEFERMGRKSDG